MTWVAFDTETTGLEPGSRLVELAAIAFDDDGGVLDTFTNLVYPGMPIPHDVIETHGLGDADVTSQPAAAEVLNRFLPWLPKDSIMIAHNASYDQGILSWECQRAGLGLPTNRVIDTRALTRAIQVTQGCCLANLVDHYGLSPLGKAHRALSDADMVRQYFHIARKIAAPMQAPWSARYSYPSTLPNQLRDLPAWVAEGRVIRFSYRNREGKASWPTLIPYGWAELNGGRLRVHGWSEWAGARRMYDAEKMSQITAS